MFKELNINQKRNTQLKLNFGVKLSIGVEKYYNSNIKKN